MEKFIKANEVAEIVGVSVTTIRRLTMNKAIPCYKFDRAVRYKPDEIETWMKVRKQEVKVVRKDCDDSLCEHRGEA